MIDLTEQTNGVSDYAELSNQPQINGVTLTGNKTSEDLNIYLPDGYTITVATDGSGDFTDIQSALDSLNGKVCAGTAIINLSAETHNISTSIFISNPMLNVKIIGDSYTTSIIQCPFDNIISYNAGGIFNIANGANVWLENVCLSSDLNSIPTTNDKFGIVTLNNGIVTLRNVKIQKVSRSINVGDFSHVGCYNNLYVSNCIEAVRCNGGSFSGNTNNNSLSTTKAIFNGENITTYFNAFNGGIISLQNNTLNFTNVTNQTNITPNQWVNDNGFIGTINI